MFFRRRTVCITTERLILRLPEHADYRGWASLRQMSKGHLEPWEPVWAPDHLSRSAFANRVYLAQRGVRAGSSVPMFIFRKTDEALVGAITLDNIRRGPNQTATCGYWMGQPFTRQGYMAEAVRATVRYAFDELDLSRIESACLPDNIASRGVLEKSGFKYEGVAQAYIQINGRWRTHVLYANLRHDRRGRTETGMS
jgi:ribosomal-protein-alanine N-acetyltransferase